jgi:carbonic anhydrase/acetyltransferase-like protein (isoleucine patch superfamily)
MALLVGMTAIVFGAVLRWAVMGSAAGVSLGEVGAVLMVSGAAALVFTLLLRLPARAVARADDERPHGRDTTNDGFNDRRAA